MGEKQIICHPDQKRTWRCRQCRALLGVVSEGHLLISHKRYELDIIGQAVAKCYRCSAENEIGAARAALEANV